MRPIVLLVESNKEVWFPTGEPQWIHLVKIIKDDLERSQLYIDMADMLAAILVAILDLENIFRFFELFLKNKVVLAKY